MPLALDGLADEVILLLESLSVENLLPLLDARRRWQLLVESLLGHAPVRGGRTRDFPFSTNRQNALNIAGALQRSLMTHKPRTTQDARAGMLSAFDLLVALQFLEFSSLAPGGPSRDSEVHYTAAIRALLDVLLPEPDHAAILDILGVGSAAADGTRSAVKRYHSERIKLAKTLAVLARADLESGAEHQLEKLLQHYSVRQQDADVLRSNRISLIFLKTKQAQPFIDRARKPFIQRGASYWCSQISARVRDLVLAQSRAARGILIDNDAVTVLLAQGEPCLDNLRDTVTEYFSSENGVLRRGFLEEQFPRLLPWYDIAARTARPSVDLIPAQGIQILSLDLLSCAGLRASPDGQVHANAKSAVISFPAFGAMHPTAAHGAQGQACSGRHGDIRLDSKDHTVPTWYVPQPGEGYGFSSIALSASALAFANATRKAIRQLLRDRLDQSLDIARTQKDLSMVLGGEPRRVAYIKFDGDHVGQLFGGLSLLARPSMSLELEALIRTAWIEATVSVTVSAGLSTVPVDLLYFGGDDLLMALPVDLVNPFLRAFDSAVLQWRQDTPELPTFTFAGVLAEPLPQRRGADNDTPACDHGMHSVNELLRLAKQSFRGESVPQPGAVESVCLEASKGLLKI